MAIMKEEPLAMKEEPLTDTSELFVVVDDSAGTSRGLL